MRENLPPPPPPIPNGMSVVSAVQYSIRRSSVLEPSASWWRRSRKRWTAVMLKAEAVALGTPKVHLRYTLQTHTHTHIHLKAKAARRTWSDTRAMAFTWAMALWSETRKAMGRCDVPCSTPMPEISCPRFASGDVREAVIKDLDISANTPSMAHELSSWISTSNSPTVPPATIGEAATCARPDRFFF